MARVVRVLVYESSDPERLQKQIDRSMPLGKWTIPNGTGDTITVVPVPDDVTLVDDPQATSEAAPYRIRKWYEDYQAKPHPKEPK